MALRRKKKRRTNKGELSQGSVDESTVARRHNREAVGPGRPVGRRGVGDCAPEPQTTVGERQLRALGREGRKCRRAELQEGGEASQNRGVVTGRKLGGLCGQGET